MANLSERATMPEPAAGDPKLSVWPNDLVHAYLEQHLPIYRELREVQKQGWQSKAGDAHFQNQRQRADNANAKAKKAFFKLMRTIGFELDHATSALTIHSWPRPAILDLCMAPGGFSSAAVSRNPSALLRGISLPPSRGGHEMLLRESWSSTDPAANIYVSFRDITLLAEEMGTAVSSIPADHPEALSFSSDRPFLDQKFDLVFCDGQVLRTHDRLEYREPFEAMRLTTSQLVLGLQRIRSGGTMVILLHKADSWRSVLLMSTFASFSDAVDLHKPQAAHTTRSSFYLVAKGVRPEREAAVEAVREWKATWNMATFGIGGGDGQIPDEAQLEVLGGGSEERVNGVLRDFGPALVRMVEPVLERQLKALKEASWMKGTGDS